MKNAKEFKERLEKDLEFKKKFENVKDQGEVIKIAKENGYDLTDCSKQEEEQLTEDMLAGIAGGADKLVGKEANVGTSVTGDGSFAEHYDDIYM